jgi:two-component system, sensor histidine kinase
LSDPTRDGLSVLLVEDDDIASHFAQVVCRKHAATVTRVSAALDAMKVLAARRFDLMVLDHQLGGVSGLQLIDAASADIERTEIIVMTANRDPSLRAKYEERGVRLFLNKPLTLDALEFAVAAVVAKIQRERAKWRGKASTG